MEIQNLGHSCFRIKGQKTILVTDPYGQSTGLKLSKTTADIVTVSHSHEDHNNVSAVAGTVRRDKPFIVSGPGEYEVANVFINGIASSHDDEKGKKRGSNTIYILNMDSVRLVHLGDLGHMLSDAVIGLINGVDVLFVPVGGTYTIDAKKAVELVNAIQPKIILPMHYAVKGLAYELDPVENFLKEIGLEVKPQEKLIFSRESLPEEREVVLLTKKD